MLECTSRHWFHVRTGVCSQDNLRTQGHVSMWRDVYLGNSSASRCPFSHFFSVEANPTLLSLVNEGAGQVWLSPAVFLFLPSPLCSRISCPSRGYVLLWSHMAEVQISLLLMMTCVILGTFHKLRSDCLSFFLFSSLKTHGRIYCFLGCCKEEPLIS